MPASGHFKSQPRIALAGSEKAPATEIPPSIRPHAAVHQPLAQGTITVTVLLRKKKEFDLSQRLTHEEFEAQYGANDDSLQLAERFAREFGLKVTGRPAPGRRDLQLSGSVDAMQKAFGVNLSEHQIGDQTCRVRQGTISIPEELSGHITAVLGLDNRPQAKPHSRAARPKASNTSYTPVQVGALYGFPPDASATSQTIGIIELGGGYRTADLKAYFKSLGLPAPTVTAIKVDKAKNTPGTANGADGEVMLDIEVSAAVAPGARIAVYFAPNTDQGFIDAISQAVHDKVNKPSVLSISWGGPESSWTGQSIAALDSACQAAAILGVTITAASGDNGSADGVADNGKHVDFPASSPHVLACGGTRLVGTGTSITSETVWNEIASNEGATGGGVSALFKLPDWQAKANVPAPANSAGGRGVPDVSGNADPGTGYQVRVDGQTAVIGGTSAVAPLWAGLIALANARNGKSAGFLNPVLYSNAGAFHDITSGNNGAFKAGPGWDACTGLGSPNAPEIIKALA